MLLTNILSVTTIQTATQFLNLNRIFFNRNRSEKKSKKKSEDHFFAMVK